MARLRIVMADGCDGGAGSGGKLLHLFLKATAKPFAFSGCTSWARPPLLEYSL